MLKESAAEPPADSESEDATPRVDRSRGVPREPVKVQLLAIFNHHRWDPQSDIGKFLQHYFPPDSEGRSKLSERTIWNVLNGKQHHLVARGTAFEIGLIYAKLNPEPLPDYVKVFLDSYASVKEFSGTPRLHNFLKAHVHVFSRFARTPNQSEWHRACNHHYLGQLFHGLGRLHGKQSGWGSRATWKRQLHKAEIHFRCAASILRQMDASALNDDEARYRPIFAELASLNALSVRWDRATDGYIERTVALHHLRRERMLERLDAAQQAHPDRWRIAWNRLVYASVLEDWDRALLAFADLVRFNPKFADFDYHQGEVARISQDTDAKAFAKRFRASHHIDTDEPTAVKFRKESNGFRGGRDAQNNDLERRLK